MDICIDIYYTDLYYIIHLMEKLSSYAFSIFL